MAKLQIAALLLALVHMSVGGITDDVGTHCSTDDAAQSVFGACASPYLSVHDNCERSLLGTATALPTGVDDTPCICSFYLAASPCLSKICDATGYSLYIDSYSSCVAQGGAAPQTTGATKTADAPATTPPPTLTGAGAGLPSSTTKPNAGSRGGVPTSVALLAALFVWSVVW